MTRASMAEVMTTHYIRSAVLKGLPYRRVILRHALRNALIAPFTVITLQINWLLSGVIVVEFFFAYKGFGALLLEASLNQDIFLIEACAMVAVFVAASTQTIADVGYTVLNPRIRFA
jgi:peptide/nickel transport system permease protein